jgi:hypothetical protein
MLTLVNTILLGTVILAIRTPDAVHIGVDSRIISVGPSVTTESSQPKLHENAGVVFAHAGIFKDTAGKLDVVATANNAIQAEKILDRVVDRFTADIQPQLLAVTPDIQRENPNYFANKRPLEMLFASARDGVPKLIVVLFTLTDQDGLKLAITRLTCPGDCRNGVSTIGLGEHDAADTFLDTHPAIFQQEGPVASLQKAIEAQAAATPEYVSLPATIWRVDNRGVHQAR